jgi:hypothetical protein
MRKIICVSVISLACISFTHLQAQTYAFPKGVDPQIERIKRDGEIVLVRKEWVSPMLHTIVQEIQSGGRTVVTKVVTRCGGISRNFDTIETSADIRVVFEHGDGSKTDDMIILKKHDRTLDAYTIGRDNIIKPVTDEQLSKIRDNEKEVPDSGNK